MAAPGTQVNVRLAPDEVALLDALRGSSDGALSRAEVLRSLLREKRRLVLDLRVAAAYDAAGAADDDLAEGLAAVSGEVLADL